LIVETKVSGTVVVIAEIVEINHLKAIQLINKSLIISVKDFLKEFYGPEILKDFKRTRYIPPAIRVEVIQRDGRRCCICGRSSSSPGVELEVDHIIPFAKGGNNHLDNLQTLCKDCNRGKGSRRF
jgi:5-methylcytosine-specific restriction endonuclease McrA